MDLPLAPHDPLEERRLQIINEGITFSLTLLSFSFCSVEGDGRPNESGHSLDGGASYGQGPVTHGSAISPDRFDSPLYSHGVQPGPQRPRRPKLQHSQSILRKQAEEEAIKRSRSLSESYELSADLQDKQVCFGQDFSSYIESDVVFVYYFFCVR